MQGFSVMSSTSPGFLKRGHHRDFALTDDELAMVIHSAKSPVTKAMLILASHGLRTSEIVVWKSSNIHPLLEDLREDYKEILKQFPDGFGVSQIAVWRRIRKAFIVAGKKKIIEVDLERLPFPEALRYRKKPPEISHLRTELAALARRLHILNSGMKDLRDPLVNCPHLDCITVRGLIGSLSHYPELRKEVANERRVDNFGEGPRLTS